eukprot:120467_1
MATTQPDSLNFHNRASSPTVSIPIKSTYLLQITNNPKYDIPCRYNPTRTGCRYGNRCYYQHFITQQPISTNYPQTQQIQQTPTQNTWNNKYYKNINTNQIPSTPQLSYENFEKFMNILFKKIN